VFLTGKAFADYRRDAMLRAAEEDDLLRVEPFGDQPGNGLNCRPVDRGFHHADALPGHGRLTGYAGRSTVALEAV